MNALDDVIRPRKYPRSWRDPLCGERICWNWLAPILAVDV
jgi:hypothetical protein